MHCVLRFKIRFDVSVRTAGSSSNDLLALHNEGSSIYARRLFPVGLYSPDIAVLSSFTISSITPEIGIFI